MCGRYQVDDNTVNEIIRIVYRVDARNIPEAGPARQQALALKREWRQKDIHPSEEAVVLAAGEKKLTVCRQRWGLPGFSGNTLVINARAETVTEKKMFRDCMSSRRIAVPAAGFYEWNAKKEKVTFARPGAKTLFMAGLYQHWEDEERFVILTTQANASVQGVHERMPLLLEEAELRTWIFNENEARQLLRKEPAAVLGQMEYEQQSFFL